MVFFGGGRGERLGLPSPTTIRDMSNAETSVKRCWITFLCPEPDLSDGFKYCAERDTRWCSVNTWGAASGGMMPRPISVLCYSIKLLACKLRWNLLGLIVAVLLAAANSSVKQMLTQQLAISQIHILSV